MSDSQPTEYQITLIAESFAAVAPRGAALVARFYQRLFRENAHLKSLFDPANQHYQQKALLTSLVEMVRCLPSEASCPLQFEPEGMLENGDGDSDARHQFYRGTLLKTLAEFAGDLWGSELEEAWSEVCTVDNRCTVS